MKIGHKTLDSRAFTIVEVMMVLAITGLLLASALSLMSGQQNKTQFAQGVNDIQASINDVINNVANGYYFNTNNFDCTKTVTGPRLATAGSNNQGAHEGCIFIGRAMQFGVDSNNTRFNVYNLVGLREAVENGTTIQASTLTQTIPTAIANSGSGRANGFPDAIEANTLLYGLGSVKMWYVDASVGGGAPQELGTVAFISGLPQYDGSDGSLVSGAQPVDLVPIPGTTLTNTRLESVRLIDGVKENPTDPSGKNLISGTEPSVKNPSGGVIICFRSGGTPQYGVITIGSNGRQLTTRLDTYPTDNPPKLNNTWLLCS